MNFKQQILLSVIILSITPAFADISVEDSTSLKYINNSGYSKHMADVVQKKKGEVNDQPYETFSKPFNWFHKAIKYVDLGTDEGLMEKHQIKPGSSVTDY